MRTQPYVVLDIETTGLSARRHGMTELFAARTDGFGNIDETFHSMINPQQPIPRFITKLTGITPDMVKDAPTQREVIRKFSKFLHQDDILVGHNIAFDLSFLQHAKKLCTGSSFDQQSLCTLRLARRVLATNPLESYRLSSLVNHFEITHEEVHRARGDVMATIEVQQALFSLLETLLPDPKADVVLGLQYWPLRKAYKEFSEK